jgi:NAD(P)-dependent dehydrogenase (short-subunit alcohol dehydrogenase family)
MPATPDLASLAGRTAVVTGGAQGIGAATAVALAAFGADVVMCDRDVSGLAATAAAVKDTGRHAATAVLDVRDTAAVDAWIGGLTQVDILVNNAGGGFHAWFADISAKGQRALVDENFTSVTNLVRACLPLMPDGASIVNVTSVEAFRAAPGFSVYAAMKAAVEQLTRTLALELCSRRIRVNCVAPDAIPTPGDEGLVAAVGAMAGYASVVPLGLGTVDDCAAAITFLAGDMSRFMTGTTLHVDGGTDAARGWRRNENGGWNP